MNYLLLTLSYDGSDYSGWVIQPKTKTIQGELNAAIKRVIKTDNFKTLGASKTDAGVHANDQKVLLTCSFNPKKLDMFTKALNKALPLQIHISSIREVDETFNIRKTIQKLYTYTINDSIFDVFKSRYEFNWTYGEIDIHKFQLILNEFIGEHDFKLFSGLKEYELATFRTIRVVDSILVQRINGRVVIAFKAPSFIRYQIRMIVGAALSAYNNKIIEIKEIKFKLAGIGTKFSLVIEPNGLCLQKITF